MSESDEDQRMAMALDSDVEQMQVDEGAASDSSESMRRGGRSFNLVEEHLDDEEGSGEDLIDDDAMMNDYRAVPELDRYDSSDLGSENAEELTFAQRAAAERSIKDRESGERRGVRRHMVVAAGDEDTERMAAAREPAALGNLSSTLSGTSDDMSQVSTGPRRRRLRENDEDVDMVEEFVNLEDYVPPLYEWVVRDAPRREICRRFRRLLVDYNDTQGNSIYAQRIDEMCSNNRQTLVVSYLHLSQVDSTVAIWVAESPKEMLEILSEEAYSVVLAMFPEYGEVCSKVFVRLSDLPVVDIIRDLRREHLNGLVRVQGVVTRRTAVYPQLEAVKFDCAKCGFVIGPLMISGAGAGESEVKPSMCINCTSKGPFIFNAKETVFRNYQRLTIQESPGKVPAGRVPRTKDVVLTGDLNDVCKPGELIDLTGIFRHSFDAFLNTQAGFPVFSTMIEANYVSKPNDSSEGEGLTEEVIRDIRSLAENPNIGRMVINSVAPSIHGHDNIKTSIALALFGGETKSVKNSHRIRGDINLLMLGDPGTAKSQFLKFVEKTADRAVFTTGKGASAVGLTASVRKDPLTREWTLEGGALVLADQGFCLIDEFDKMNEQDRTSIHEAMEQQSISISKAGIVATLQARCSVFAAANPIGGRYDSSRTFAENVELTDPIVSRFDCLCVVRDTVDPIVDHQLALHVVKNHIKSHPGHNADVELHAEGGFQGATRATIPQDMLRKYIRYARSNISPKLTNLDEDRIATLYAELRRESVRTGAVMIAVRHIESIIRLAEASAKMHLRTMVQEDDLNLAISVMIGSFVGAQKFQVMNALKKKFSKYISLEKDSNELLFFALKGLARDALQVNVNRDGEQDDQTVEVSVSDMSERAREFEIYNLEEFFKSPQFTQSGFSHDAQRQVIIRNF